MIAQKENLKKYFRGSHKLPQAHEEVCNDNETNKEKNNTHVKMLLIEEGVYRTYVENSCHGYRASSR